MPHAPTSPSPTTRRYADEINDFFGGALAEEIAKENEKNVAIGVTARMLEDGWEGVCEVIRAIPEVDVLKNAYATLGVKSSLSDIDVPDKCAGVLLKYSHLVRNRLTLMRLAGCFN